MALKGTLKDFGIADIFQLISHQSKTGVLYLNSKDQQVRISFHNGDVIRAEPTARKKQDLLGSMLVRAEAISPEQLEQALEIQQRTLKRLGSTLVDCGFIGKDDLKQFNHLQTTETIYRLFHWDSGTYAFELEQVSYDQDTADPIRSENVLMEGFRMIDEWPMIRKKIASCQMTFKKIKELPAQQPSQTADDDLDGALDGVFSGAAGGGKEGPGRNEASVYQLIAEGRSVQKLIDLSRLGEFETCKALYNLLLQGYIKGETTPQESARTEKIIEVRSISAGRIFWQAAMYLFIAALLVVLYRTADLDLLSFSGEKGTPVVESLAAREVISRAQERRLRSALDVHFLETGAYPQSLEELFRQGLVREGELRFPWRNSRIYERRDGGYLLLRPFE